VLADTSKINKKAYVTDPNGRLDYQFCRWLTKEIGVAAIPPSAFYSNENASAVANYARFAFCKRDETLREAEKRMQKLQGFVEKS
jgi:aspartate/methionine/tyrosine aminotransferase